MELKEHWPLDFAEILLVALISELLEVLPEF